MAPREDACLPDATRWTPSGTTRTCKVSRQSHLTECIRESVLESQLPHKIVNLLFTINRGLLAREDARWHDAHLQRVKTVVR